jgi:hypothetical protein
MSGERWDVRLTPTGSGSRQSLKLNLPVALSAPMQAAGFNRAEIEISPEGILVRPYSGEGGNQSLRLVDIPETWGRP